MPIETGRMDVGIVNQRVPVDDVLRKLLQQLARTGRANPQGQLRDLHRLGRKIHAVQILSQNERRNFLGKFLRARFVQLLQVADHFMVPRLQHVIGLEQKRPAATGGIDDFEVAQDRQASPPVLGVVGRHAPARFLFGHSQLDRHRRKALRDQLFHRVMHDKTGQFRRGVVDAKLLSLGRLWHCRVLLGLLGVAEQARLLEFFQLRNRPLEQMPQHVEVHFVGEIVVADRVEEVRPGLVGQIQLVDRVRREQSAVVLRNAVRFVAAVDETKQILKFCQRGLVTA